MPRLNYFFVAESVSVDELTKGVSATNVLDEVAALELPSTIPHVVAFSCWEATPEELGRTHEFILRHTLPNGVTNDVPSRFLVEKKWNRVRQQFRGVPIHREGELTFELILPDGTVVARQVAEVKLKVRGPAPPTSQRN